jgi:hypothetical protein
MGVGAAVCSASRNIDLKIEFESKNRSFAAIIVPYHKRAAKK